MQVLLNKPPGIAHSKEAYLALMEDGYALPIGTHGNATVLLFNDVEDHIDGNGMCILWMLEGEGTFFYEGSAIALKKGDALVFDDRIEHGFEAEDYCLAVNFDIGLNQHCDAAFVDSVLQAYTAQHLDEKEFSESAPSF